MTRTTARPARALGIDIGTSGVRAAAICEDGMPLEMEAVRFERPDRMRDPAAWLASTSHAVRALAARVDLGGLRAIAVDGTSGSMVAVDADLRPLASAMMYADPVRERAVLDRIAEVAPADSPALGPQSALARAMVLAHLPGAMRVLHQADFVLAHLAGTVLPSDETNALKTGYDPILRGWGDWIEAAGFDMRLLPQVRPAGVPLGPCGAWGQALGLPKTARLHAGVTDGCAAFLATGAGRAGDGVTSLGSTLVLKLVSDRPVFDAASGVYSHRIGDIWLAGGASNSGGAVLANLFGREALADLDARIDPDRPTGLDYYPLLCPGERFPVSDPTLAPRLMPRPESLVLFYQAVLEGIAAIEAMGYRKLSELGAPPLARLRSVGGGAAPGGFTALRKRVLDVDFAAPISTEAAVGVARLALREGQFD